MDDGRCRLQRRPHFRDWRAGQLGLVFDFPQKEWNGEAAADNFNRQFLRAFVSTRPDYVRVFGFVLARFMKPDGAIIATVAESLRYAA